jgi:regulator of protease activity HflC (stomatin/prohibitin superfamily)
MKELEKHTHGFKMPEGYLASFEATILKKLQQEGETKSVTPINGDYPIHKKGNIISLQRIVLFGLSAAACIALYIGIQNNQTTKVIDSLAMTTIEDYILSENFDITINDISDELPSEFLDELENSTSISDISEETIEAYLIETITINTLINE